MIASCCTPPALNEMAFVLASYQSKHCNSQRVRYWMVRCNMCRWLRLRFARWDCPPTRHQQTSGRLAFRIRLWCSACGSCGSRSV